VTIPFSVSLDVHSTSASFNTMVLFTQVLIGAVSLVVLIANRAYLRLNGALQYEYDLLLILSIVALFLICWASDFLTMYIAIELLSLSFYSLVGLNGRSELSVESAIKYFILGSVASCILLFGISLVYADCGTIVFADFVSLSFGDELPGLKRLQFGFCLVLIALLFKLGLVPFHMWLCDVYEGAMSSLTLFFATLPKLAIIFFVVKLIYVVFPTFSNF
jgi:NADH-quinone oxidoreductase subunit N